MRNPEGIGWKLRTYHSFGIYISALKDSMAVRNASRSGNYNNEIACNTALNFGTKLDTFYSFILATDDYFLLISLNTSIAF